MGTFDIVIILGAICGLSMVIGGMGLLYKGVITLNQASTQEAASLEFKKMLKITTHYPALGLFIIGLAFVIIAVVFSKSTQNQFEITGRITNIDDPDSLKVVITVPAWEGTANVGGEINASVIPRIDRFNVWLTYPGYRDFKKLIKTKESKLGVITIGEQQLQKVVEKPLPDPNNIMRVEGLPPISAHGAF